MDDQKIPKIIQEVGFDFDWDESSVWVLNVPVEKISMMIQKSIQLNMNGQ